NSEWLKNPSVESGLTRLGWTHCRCTSSMMRPDVVRPSANFMVNTSPVLYAAITTSPAGIVHLLIGLELLQRDRVLAVQQGILAAGGIDVVLLPDGRFIGCPFAAAKPPALVDVVRKIGG